MYKVLKHFFMTFILQTANTSKYAIFYCVGQLL